MNFSFKEICEFDFNGLPDDALKAVYHECHRVICKRRLIVKANNHEITALNNKFHSITSKHRLKEFSKIESQDWSCTYPQLGGAKEFYVYAHVEKSKRSISLGGINFGGIPFYIGKGTGNRAYDLKRNEGHGATLKKLLDAGHERNEIVKIFKDNMTESEALCLEAKLIFFLGTKFSAVRNGVLVNLAVPKFPSFMRFA